MSNKPPLLPDLDEWLACGGGYFSIDWIAWDRAVAEWNACLRAELERDRERAEQQQRKERAA